VLHAADDMNSHSMDSVVLARSSPPLEPSPGGPLPMNLVQQELINKLITIIRSCDHHATKQQPEVHARDQVGSR
jgi:hypothetical protein